MKMYVAVRDGFYNGVRVKAGASFPGPDDLTSKNKKKGEGPWFVPKDEYKKPASKQRIQDTNDAARRKAESFVTLMKKVAEDPIPEPIEETGKRTRKNDREVI